MMIQLTHTILGSAPTVSHQKIAVQKMSFALGSLNA